MRQGPWVALMYQEFILVAESERWFNYETKLINIIRLISMVCVLRTKQNCADKLAEERPKPGLGYTEKYQERQYQSRER